MASRLFTQALLAVIAIAVLVFYLRYIEKRSLFYPEKEISFFPKDAGLEFEDIHFKSPDGYKLNGWFIPAKGAHYTILFTHGNAGNISHRIEKLRLFQSIGCNVFIFDYRGYGASQGRPSEKGLYLDAQAAYNYLLSRKILPGQIIGYGESLGGAVIIDVALKAQMRALIAESTFSSAKDMIQHIYPFLPYWIFASRMDSVSKIKSLRIPKLIIHSKNDEIVPYQLGKKLFDAAPEPKEFLDIRGGHNSGFFESEGILKEAISNFIKGL